MSIEAEQTAIRRDATSRVAVLLELRQRLLPEQDDPFVLSELTVVDSEITAARRAMTQ